MHFSICSNMHKNAHSSSFILCLPAFFNQPVFFFLISQMHSNDTDFTELIPGPTPLYFTPLTPFCAIGEGFNLQPLLVLTVIRRDGWRASSSFSFKSLKHALGCLHSTSVGRELERNCLFDTLTLWLATFQPCSDLSACSQQVGELGSPTVQMHRGVVGCSSP